jgi:NADP-dependent aldehyde dehydrogenase
MTTTSQETGEQALEAALQAADTAAEPFGGLRPAERARMLNAVADALEASSAELVPLAMSESGLPEARLTGELNRTVVQLRLFADVLLDGSYLGVIMDEADQDFAIGPRPDLRRIKLPLGPVLVFAASNFPFAFSVAGGDTASALAAGCPVLLKAHPGHPELSVLTGRIVRDALAEAGAPDGTFDVISGVEPGVLALRDERITAAAFTGSLGAGRALFDIAASRPTPIPFYGELGSVNPAFVTPGAVAAMGEQLARDFVGSFTLGVGQFCTSPGLLFLPEGHGLEQTLIDATGGVPAARMLTGSVHRGYAGRRGDLLDVDGVRVLADAEPGDGLSILPTLLATDVRTLLANRDTLFTETFGPLSVVVTYADDKELVQAAEAMEGSLTAAVHVEEDEGVRVSELVRRLQGRCGRLLFNGWPTGVAVTPAMQHGGPYPATTAPTHTSVGSTAIDRFLRPITFQNAPDALLPEALKDDNPLGIPRATNPAGQSRSWGRR